MSFRRRFKVAAVQWIEPSIRRGLKIVPVSVILRPVLGAISRLARCGNTGTARSSVIRLPLTGGCQCGALRYEISQYHCTDCQRLTGSAFSMGLVTAAERAMGRRWLAVAATTLVTAYVALVRTLPRFCVKPLKSRDIDQYYGHVIRRFLIE